MATHYRAAKQGVRNVTAVGPNFDEFWAAILWANARGYEAIKEFSGSRSRLVGIHYYGEDTVAQARRDAETWIGKELESGRNPMDRIDGLLGLK